MSGSTSDDIGGDESLVRLFSWDDWQEQAISLAVFRSDEVSVWRSRYVSLEEMLAQVPGVDGAATLLASFVRTDPRGNLDVTKSEPPSAHAHIETREKKRNTVGQARRLRDEAMKNILRTPTTPASNDPKS